MIPKKIHFIYFNTSGLNLIHYIAVKSAAIMNPGFEVNFYYTEESNNPYFEKIKKYAKAVLAKPKDEIFGNKLKKWAHKADVLRLEILNTDGGIYLDIDTITLKSYEPLLNNRFVMGQEKNHSKILGLCNAVMMSEKNSRFSKAWYYRYDTFNNKKWNEHSVKLPLALSKDVMLRDEITVVPNTFFFNPSWNDAGLEKLFVKNNEYPESYCYHLWYNISYDKYLKDLTEDKIKNIDTTYNVAARKFLD